MGLLLTILIIVLVVENSVLFLIGWFMLHVIRHGWPNENETKYYCDPQMVKSERKKKRKVIRK